MAILGQQAGLLLVDLESGADVADRFPPEQMDLADGAETRHMHHSYRDLAFDASGEKLAVAFRPGAVRVWSRAGELLLQEDVAVNPKSERLVTFADGGVYYCDSLGDRALLQSGLS